MIRPGLALAAATAATVGAFRAGPPPGYTGAFGEPDCGVCHFDAIRDDDAGAVLIEGPDRYIPGASREITIRLHHPELAAGGFQLTARYLEGDDGGRQAGTLESVDGRTLVQPGAGGVVYASHNEDGVAPAADHAGDDPTNAEGSIQWTVLWTAPGRAEPVAFDVVAHAANDDDSPLGERFYQARRIVRPTAEK